MHNYFMYHCIMFSKDYLKGSIKTILLNLLHSRGEMYGYEITQMVKLRSEESIVLTEGALYPALHKLQSLGLVKSHNKIVDGRTRKYYQLTSKGETQALQAKEEWQNFSSQMNAIINPFSHA